MRVFADFTFADLRRIATRRQSDHASLRSRISRSLEAILAGQHGIQRRLPADDIEQCVVEFDVEEARDSAQVDRNRASSARTSATHARVVSLRPPRCQVMPIVASRSGFQIFLRVRSIGTLPASKNQPSMKRNDDTIRLSDRGSRAGSGHLWHQIVRRWLLNPRGYRVAAFEIEAEVVRGLDPRHDARDVVEVHVAARAQAVKNLLQPRRAAFAVRRDDDVVRPRLERERSLNPFGRTHAHSARGEFFEGFRASGRGRRCHRGCLVGVCGEFTSKANRRQHCRRESWHSKVSITSSCA